MERTMKTIRYPLSAEDAGDKVHLLDGEGSYVIYGNTELSLNQWKFIAETLNEAGKNGRYIPAK
jgi:hypothetical protein